MHTIADGGRKVKGLGTPKKSFFSLSVYKPVYKYPVYSTCRYLKQVFNSLGIVYRALHGSPWFTMCRMPA
jgi:hypothetical protein